MFDWTERELVTSLAVTASVGCLSLAAYHVMQRRNSRRQAAPRAPLPLEDSADEEEDVPELFVDVISQVRGSQPKLASGPNTAAADRALPAPCRTS